MATTESKKPPYGPNIVRAWFASILEVDRGLAVERGYLADRNWTYRFQNDALDYLAPVSEHLSSNGRLNFEHFTSFFPDIKEPIKAHDTCVFHLRLACSTLHEAIIQDAEFRRIFEIVGSEANQMPEPKFDAYFGAYSSDEDRMGILSEYLVNNVERLPSFYTTAGLWNQYRGRFVDVLSSTHLANLRRNVETAGELLHQVVENLDEDLAARRSSLALEFDVPIAPETVNVS